MKKTIVFLALISMIACKEKAKNIDENEEIVEVEKISEENQTELNTMIDDPEEEGTKMLLGKINKRGLDQDEFPWFEESMIEVELDAEVVEKLAIALQGLDIEVFMGTWCEDSQREVPHLFSILNKAKYDLSTIEMYAVSHDKTTPSGAEKDKNIEFVPTIILLKNGKEMGRIVESTQETLEKDLLKIATGKPYKHIYEE